MNTDKNEETKTIEVRLEAIERLLGGDDKRWSFAELEQIISKTDLDTTMEDIELQQLECRVKNIEDILSTQQKQPDTVTDRGYSFLKKPTTPNIGHCMKFIGKQEGLADTPLGTESLIGHAIVATAKLADMFSKLRESEDPADYFAVEGMLRVLIDAAGLEVS
jgi:hypothetical protein